MANYIDRELLCEAYTHLDIETHSDLNNREKLEAELREFILPRARFIFNEEVELRFEFEEGSLKTKIAVLGSAAVLIGSYGDFRQGVDQLARDAVVLAQAANLEVIFKTRTLLCDRIRIEKRSGVFGRITDLLRQAQEIRDNAGHHRFPDTEPDLNKVHTNVEALSTWYSDVDKLIQKLESNETRACVAAGLLEELERFPEQMPWIEDARADSFRARMLKEDVDLASKVDAIAARYARLLALSKEQLKKVLLAALPRNA
jgi:hypothetical protein